MLLLALFAACTGGADTAETADTCADAPNVTWNSFGDGFFRTYCRACHSANTEDRFGAPDDVNFDTVDEVRTLAPAIRSAVIDQGTMPVGGGVYDDDITLLGYYLDCGL